MINKVQKVRGRGKYLIVTLIPDQIPTRLRSHPVLRRWHELLGKHRVSERLQRRWGNEFAVAQLLVLVTLQTTPNRVGKITSRYG